MKTLLLTSGGMQIKDEILKILSKVPADTKVGYIITALQGDEGGGYHQDHDTDLKEMQELGLQVTIIDIEGKHENELRELLSDFDVIYVQGGNTFYLLKWVRESGFDIVIKELINKGVIYIGVSAGTIIMAPTIEVAGWKNLDRNEVGLKDLTALNYVPFHMFVHYGSSYNELIREHALKAEYPVRILTNDQAFLVQDDKVTLVGKGKEVNLWKIA